MSEKWVGRLGTPNQWRGVPYVEKMKNKEVRCLLCGTGAMSNASRISHFNGPFHKAQYEAVRKEEMRREHHQRTIKLLYATKGLQSRIESLGCAEWRNHFAYMIFNLLPSGDDRVSSKLTIMGLGSLFNLKRKLQFYEWKETTSLLELAVWKASICNLHFSSIEEMKEYPVLETSFNPSEYMRTCRVTSGCAVITRRVMLFLGWD